MGKWLGNSRADFHMLLRPVLVVGTEPFIPGTRPERGDARELCVAQHVEHALLWTVGAAGGADKVAAIDYLSGKKHDASHIAMAFVADLSCCHTCA